MAALFSSPDRPTVKEAPPPPDRTSDQVNAAATEQRQRFYGSGSGRASTFLTGGLGVPGGTTGTVSRILGQVGR